MRARRVAAFGDRRTRAAPTTRARRPRCPRPDEVPVPRRPRLGPADRSRFEVRPALGAALFAGADEALTGGWLRLARRARHSTPRCSRCSPTPGSRRRACALRGPVAAPTIDLTVHFRAAAAPRRRARRAGARRLPLDAPPRDGFFEEDGELWTPRRRAARAEPPARAARRSTGRRRDDRLPRPRLERRRPPREPAGRGRRAARRTACACSRRRRPTTPTRSARSSTSRRSSTPACGSRPTLEPEALLDACKAVERELGRDPRADVRHGPRPIDVDLLLLGDTEYRSERLTLPHEQVLARRFVLIPLLELDFDLRTPDGDAAGGRLARAAASTRACGAPAARCVVQR